MIYGCCLDITNNDKKCVATCMLLYFVPLNNLFYVHACRSTQKKKGAITEKKKIPKSTFDATRGTTQPSQKWKSLGLTDEKFYTAPQSPIKTASRYTV